MEIIHQGFDGLEVSFMGALPGRLRRALAEAKESDKPTMIAARTTIGYGAPKKAGTKDSHGSPLGPDEIAGAREALGWNAAPFVVPDEVLDAWRIAGLRSAQKRKEWQKRLEASESELRGEFERRHRLHRPLQAR